MSGAAVSLGTSTGVVIAACYSRRRGDPVGSDAALLAALSSGRHSDLLVVRSGLWSPDTTHVAGCRVRVIRPPVGRPWAAGPTVRRCAGSGVVPVWAEPRDLASLRGFARAAMDGSLGARKPVGELLEHARSASTDAERGDRAAAVILVLGSHPARLDARGIVFAASLAAVAGQRVRVVVPRGTRSVDSGRRYARRLNLALSLEICDGPSWLGARGADAVLLDRKHEASTRFGPALVRMAEALGKPIVDLPGTLPVGQRDARRFGKPLIEALERTPSARGPTVPAA